MAPSAWSPGGSGDRQASSLALTLIAFTAPVAPASSPRPTTISATPSAKSEPLRRRLSPRRDMTYGGVQMMPPTRPATAVAASLSRRAEISSRLDGLHADDPGGHRHVAHHHHGQDDAEREREPAQPPARDQDGGESQRQADDSAPANDRPGVPARLPEHGLQVRRARPRDREGEGGVEEERAYRDQDSEHEQHHDDRPADDVEFLAVQHVRLQVERHRPDQQGRKSLDQHQPPVRHQQPQRAEQHDERADDQGQRREDLPSPGELEDCLLDRVFVAVTDGDNEPPPELTDRTAAASSCLLSVYRVHASACLLRPVTIRQA